MLRADRWDEIIWNYVASVLKEPEKIVQVYREAQAAETAAIASIQKRLTGIEQKIASNNAKHQLLLDEFLDKSALTREALEVKAAQLNTMNRELEVEADNLRAQLNRKVISEDTIAAALAWCKQAREGIDYFTFEDRLSVINLLDVKGVVERGATREQDTILITGFLPAVRLEANGLLYTSLRNIGSL